MAVSWELASTTTLVVLAEATQVCAGPQSCEGGHPPQVCPQPSSPQVFPMQSEVQLTPADPPDGPLPPVPGEVPPVAPGPDPPWPVGMVVVLPLCAPQPRRGASATRETSNFIGADMGGQARISKLCPEIKRRPPRLGRRRAVSPPQRGGGARPVSVARPDSRSMVASSASSSSIVLPVR